MIMKRVLFILAFLSFSLVSCEIDDPVSPEDLIPRKDIVLTKSQSEFVRSNNGFALDLFKRVSQKENGKSLLISPLSVTIDFGMVNNGAVGQTQKEIYETLGYGEGSVEGLNDFCHTMMEQSAAVDPSTTLEIANAAVVNKLYPGLKDSFTNTVKSVYDAEVIYKDFGKEDVKKLINDIVAEQHHHPCIGAWVMGAENGTLLLQNGNKLLNAISPVDMTRPVISNLNSIYIDNEGNFRKDTGKLLPVSVDKISTYATLRMNPRMTPNAAYTHYLAHSFDRDAEEISVPDTGLGDSHFQDEEENVVSDINNKMLVTLKNHTLLPETATNIKGPRSSKNQKAIKNAVKAVETFVESDMSIWKDYKSFVADANRIAIKSKLDQITALQSNPQIAGFFLDQWADCGTEFDGLCDENRVSKGFEDFSKEITTPSRALISELEHVVAPQSEISFQVTLLNNSRYEDVSVEVKLVDANGKELATDKISPEEPAGKTSLTQMGICTMMAPRAEGSYKLQVTLINDGNKIHTTEEDLIVIAEADVKSAMKKVCFLDNSEESSDALAALTGPEQVIFTANLSSWPDEILDKIVDVVKNGGKTLLLSDLTQEDIDYMNQSHQFDCNIESHWSTGANELSLHYLPKDSELAPAFGETTVLDSNDAAIMPSISLNELPGAKVFARSVTLKDGEVKTGSDLQLYPFGNGKIMFNQFNVFEGLETNVLADKLFATIVNLL